MPDVQLTRDFDVSPERLFQALSTQAEVLNWWGHDGMTLISHALDFSRTGPWHSQLTSAEGNQFKMSGQVTRVEAPRIIGFTWAWHDPQDNRGAESHVTFTIAPTATGARLTIDHRDLPQDAAETHLQGWTNGPVKRLERFIKSLST